MNAWQFAIKTLCSDRGKMITALAGVAFSIVLVNIQTGLFVGMICKATVLLNNGQADIWVGHKGLQCVDLPADIPRRFVHRIRATPGVETAQPYLFGYATMALPGGGYEGLALIGVERTSLLGSAWNYSEGTTTSIRQSHGLVVDEYDDLKLCYPQVGEVREVSGHRTRIAAKTRGITNFLIAPYAFTTLDRAARYLRKSPDLCSYVLVQVESDVDVEQVCESIRQRIPELDAYSCNEFTHRSIKYWLTRTGLGVGFGLSTLIGFWIGLVMVSQTLYTMALDRLGEYATLKAIGASSRQLYIVLLIQATAIAIGGSVLGLAVALAIQAGLGSPIAPIVIPVWASLGSCALLMVICLGSATVPYLRLRRVDSMFALRS